MKHWKKRHARQAIRHDTVLKMTRHCAEDSLPFVPFVNPDEVVGVAWVESGEHPDRLELLKSRWYEWEWVWIFDSDLV